MVRFLWFILICLIVVVAGETYFYFSLKPRGKPPVMTRVVTPKSVSLSPASAVHAPQAWQSSAAVGTYHSPQYGTVYVVSARIDKIDGHNFQASTAGGESLDFSLTPQTKFVSRYELPNRPSFDQEEEQSFSLEKGQVAAIQWLDNTSKPIKVWRISRQIIKL